MGFSLQDILIYTALVEDLCPDFETALEEIAGEGWKGFEGKLAAGGRKGCIDVTSGAVFSGERGEASVVAKSRGVLSGSLPFTKVYRLVDPGVSITFLFEDGGAYGKGDTLAVVKGRVRSILLGERVALNFLGHLSGVATEVRALTRLLEGSGVTLLDTRKTLPGMRSLEKSAVLHGGGKNHRMGLYDMVLIKDNHVDGAGSITEAVRRVRESCGREYRIEVETRTLDEVREALSCGVDRIMLDNMSMSMMRRAARIVSGQTEIEVSGNMSARRVRKIRRLPVDFVSVGYVTHSARQADFSMRLVFSSGL